MKSLTRDEFKTLVGSVQNPLWKLMLKVGFWHGLRVSELINLKGRDIRDGFVAVQRLKGSLKTVQPYIKHPDPDLDEHVELTDLANHVGLNDKLFPITRDGVRKLMQRNGKRVGIPGHKLFPHVLKHSIAMQTIGQIGIENLRQYLGHKSIASTGEYLKISDEAASAALARSIL